MRQRDIIIGKKIAVGYEISIGNKKLVMVKAEHGFICCGYLNLDIAEKFKDAAALVQGVSTIDELLNTKIVKVTSYAAKRGIKLGMKGNTALWCLL